MSQRRYPGAKPFTRAQAPLFHGREADIAQLYRLVSLESLAVLYGKSGYGKSSLLNAGLVPKLEEDAHAQSLSLRFQAWTPAEQASPVEKVVDQLQQLPQDRQLLDKLGAQDNSLWSYTKAWQLAQPQRRLVLIFDQFEELFSYPAEQIQVFKTQLAELLRGQLPDRYEALLDENPLSPAEESALDRPLDLRILFSIRSDRMHLLDQLSDYLPQVLKNNYELKALTESDARRALVEPAAMPGTAYAAAPFTYSEAAQTKILDFLSEEDHGRVEAIQLQILCTTFENRAIAEGLTHFDAAAVGDLQGIIDNYYHTQLAQISDEADREAAARLLEEGLVDKSREQRLTLHESQIASIYGVGARLLDQLVDSNLLRREPDRRQGYTYELSHDTLIKPALVAREKRELAQAKVKAEQQARELEEERKKRRRLVWLSVSMGILTLASVAGGLLAYQQYQKAQKAIAIAETEAKNAQDAAFKANQQGQIATAARLQTEMERDRSLTAEKAALLAQDQAEAQRRLAEAEAAKGRLLEETLASENAFAYLLAEGHRFFGEGDFRNALTYWANARFVEPDDPRIDQLVEVALLGVRAEDDFLNGRFAAASSAFHEILEWPISVEPAYAKQRLADIKQSQEVWDKLIGDRNLADIDTLIIEDLSIFALPASLGDLSGLSSLYIRSNSNLTSLPASLGSLSELHSLTIYGNDGLTSLPASLGSLSKLQSLTIRYSRNLTSLPASLGSLSELYSLTIYGNDGLTSLPASLGSLSELQSLTIYDNNDLTSLPESLKLLRSLKCLSISKIEDLVVANEATPILKSLDTLVIYASNLTSLPASLGSLSELHSLTIYGNDSLTSLPESLGSLSELHSLTIRSNSKLTSLPESLGGLSSLSTLDIYDNTALTSLPESLGSLSSLSALDISSNSKLTSLPESLGGLSSLSTLDISSNSKLTSLPESLGDLLSLSILDISFNRKLTSLPASLEQLANSLKTLDIRYSSFAKETAQYWKTVLPNTQIYSDYD